MTERIFVRGFGCRPNGGGTSADFGYHMIGAIAAREPDDEPEDGQSGAPAIGLDRLEQDPVNLRAPYGTTDLCPRIMIDDFSRASGDGTGCQALLIAPLPAVEQFLYANERKFSNTEPARIWGPTLQQAPVEPNSPRLVSMSDLIGVDPNPSPVGGGLHQTKTGGFSTSILTSLSTRIGPRGSGG